MRTPRLFFFVLVIVLLGGFWVTGADSSTSPAVRTAPQSPSDMTLVQLTNIPNAQAGYFMDAYISGNGRKAVYGDAGTRAYRTLYLVDVDGNGAPQVIDRKEDMYLLPATQLQNHVDDGHKQHDRCQQHQCAIVLFCRQERQIRGRGRLSAQQPQREVRQ